MGTPSTLDNMSRWGHEECVIHVGDFEEIIFPVREETTIEHCIEHCDRILRERDQWIQIEGLSSPHLLNEWPARQWGRGDRIWELDGPFEDGVQFIAIIEGWDGERLREHHRGRYGHHGW